MKWEEKLHAEQKKALWAKKHVSYNKKCKDNTFSNQKSHVRLKGLELHRFLSKHLTKKSA